MRLRIVSLLVIMVALCSVNMINAQVFTVDDIIKFGLKNSYDMASQKYTLKMSENSLYSSVFAFLPDIGYNLTRVEQDNKITKSGNLNISETISSNDMRIFSLIKNLSSNKEKNLQFSLAKREFIYSIINYYVMVLEKEQYAELANQSLVIARRNYKESTILHRYGKLSDLDLEQANLSLNRAIIDSVSAQNDVENSIMTLCYAVSIPYKTDYTFTMFPYEFKNVANFSFNVAQHLSILQLKEELYRSKVDVVQNTLDFLPTISASVSKHYPWKNEQWYRFNEDPMQFSLSLSYPLLRPLTNLPYHNNTRLAFKDTQLRLDKKNEKLIQEFEMGIRHFKQKKETYVLSQKQELLEKRYFEVMNEKFTLGVIDITNLEEARKKYFSSAVSRISAYYGLVLQQETLHLLTNDKILEKY